MRFMTTVFFGLVILVTAVAGCAVVEEPPRPAPLPTWTPLDTPTAEPTPFVQQPSPTAGESLAASSPSISNSILEDPTSTPILSLAENQEDALRLAPVPLETTDATRVGAFTEERVVNLPPGFGIRVFAAGLQGVRMMRLSPDGVVYATVRGDGKIVMLPDTDQDGVADEVKVFADGLPGVHGLDFKDGALYVATEREIVRLQDTDGDGAADKRDAVVNDLPVGGNHKSRTIVFGPDGKLYLSVGSECNACIDSDERQAAISRYSADATFEKVYAKGIRNAVGVVFHPVTNEMWATNNGRDMLGDELPPETIYNVKEEVDYGYPFCYGHQVPDETQNPPPGYCEKTGVPAVQMQAHSAPLGLAFYYGALFPAEFQGDMFVAFHGSWNRSEFTGYKVVRIRFKDNQPDTSAGELLVEDFATGWLDYGHVWGRPVDIIVAPDGSLLLSDDYANAIYNIY